MPRSVKDLNCKPVSRQHLVPTTPITPGDEALKVFKTALAANCLWDALANGKPAWEIVWQISEWLNANQTANKVINCSSYQLQVFSCSALGIRYMRVGLSIHFIQIRVNSPSSNQAQISLAIIITLMSIVSSL